MRNADFSDSPETAGNGNIPAPIATEATQAAPIKLSSLLGILWRRLWVVLVCTLLAAGIGLFYVRNVTPIYKSTAKVMVDRTGPTLVHRTDDTDMLLQTDNFRRTQAEIIKSLAVIGKLADNPTLKASGALDDIDGNPVAYAKQNLDTKVGDDDLLYISFDAKKPGDAAAFCNAVVESYLDFVAEQRHQTSTDVLKILEKEKEKQDADFSDRLKRLTDYRMANGDVATGEGTSNPIITQLLQYSDALSRAQLDMLDAKATLEAAQGLKDNTESLQQFIRARGDQQQTEEESAKVRRVRDDIETETHTLQEIQEHFTDNYPQVQLHKDRLANLQKDLEKAEEDYRNAVLLAMSQHVELAQSVVTRLEGLVGEQRKAAENLNTNMAQLELLEAEYNQSKQMVEMLNSRIKEVNLGDQAGAMNVMKVEPAVPVSEPFSPNKSKILRIAIVLGILLGLVSALSLEMMDDRLRTAESASAATGLAPLSVIPATYKSEPRALGLMVHKEPHSQFSEAFRTLRTAIFFGTLEGQRKTILMTSPLPGEGKSTLTANLAQALAQAACARGIRAAQRLGHFQRHLRAGVAGEDDAQECMRQPGRTDVRAHSAESVGTA